jgi:thioredoxin reductase
MNENYDVVIIGGGAAGLNGALALARARRSVLVIDSGQPRNAPASHVHNYLTRDGTPPAELLAIGRAEATGYGAEIISAEVATAALSPSPGAGAGAGGTNGRSVGSDVAGERAGQARSRFTVTMTDGSRVQSRRLLVTTGLVDELPALPGLAERFGRDVLHCPYCHGWEVRDQSLGILGTGPMAVHQAQLFRQWCADVILFQHTAPAPSGSELEGLNARGISVVTGEVTGLEVKEDRLTGVRLASGQVVARQALAVATRMNARGDLLAGLGLKLADLDVNGHVFGSYVPTTDPFGATEVPGVWVAGNVTDLRAQVITAAAAGLNAGAGINASLVEEDIEVAIAATRATN